MNESAYCFGFLPSQTTPSNSLLLRIVSFGTRYEKTPPTIRNADAKPANPDLYPKSWGMTKIRQRDYPPINQLKGLMGKSSDAKEPPKSPAK